MAADAADESLRKYKESLMGAAARGDLGDTSDPRRDVSTEFRVMFEPGEGHEGMVFNTDSDDGINNLKSQGLTMKEGCKYKFRCISFRCKRDFIDAPSGMMFRGNFNYVAKNQFVDKDGVNHIE